MLSLQKLVGRVRGSDAPSYPENREYEEVHLNNTGDFLSSQGLPPLAEIVRLGNSWQVLGAASTGLATTPTTAGLLTIWNGENGNGNHLVIDSVVATKVIADVTTDDLATIWAQIIRPPMATPTDAALTIRSLSGRYSYGGRVRTVATGVTIANRWEAIGCIPNTSAAIAGSPWAQVGIDLLGRFIIPPGGAFTLHASEVTATASTFRFCIRWHEVLQPLVG